MSGYALQYKEYDNRYLCTSDFRGKASSNNVTTYEVVNVSTMEELINYALIFNEEVIIPPEYDIKTIYSLILTTSDFNPKCRERSVCTSNIIDSSFDEKHINKLFNKYVKNIGKENHIKFAKNIYCWHTEDYAYNQIIHSYKVEKSYIISKK